MLSQLEMAICKIQRKPVENLMKNLKIRKTFPTPVKNHCSAGLPLIISDRV